MPVLVKRRVLSILLAVFAIYGVYAAVMIWLHPRFVYPFQPEDVVLDGFERVEVAGADGMQVSLQERPGRGPVVLYFMGNAGALTYFDVAFVPHIAADRHIIALEYRGGAGRPGQPSEIQLKSDALVAADYALALSKQTIVQGYSLGSGLATHVAARRDVDGVLLVAPYDRLCRLLSARSYLPACLLPFVQKWRSLDDAAGVDVPIHVLHGTQDDLIPESYSAAFSTLPNVTRRLIEGAGHTDLAAFPAYNDGIAGAFVHLDAN